jgi:ribosome biogenesis GTPase A
MGYWGVVNNCLKNADLILLIMDARVPEDTRNLEIERRAETLGKEVVFVFNKSDLITRKEETALQKHYFDAFFVSSKRKNSVAILRKFLNAKGNNREKALRIALIGYPNVGKSSIFNMLVPEAKAKVSSISGTTKKTEWIRSGHLRFMDSPGVIPRGDSKVQVGITASKDPHKIPFPERVALKILKVIRKTDEKILKKFYNFDFEKDDSDYEVFLKFGKAKGHLIKGGEVDENRAGIKIVDDWQKGKLGLK